MIDKITTLGAGSSIPLDLQELAQLAADRKLKAYAVAWVDENGEAHRWLNTSQTTVKERHAIYFGLGMLSHRIAKYSNDP